MGLSPQYNVYGVRCADRPPRNIWRYSVETATHTSATYLDGIVDGRSADPRNCFRRSLAEHSRR